TFTLAPPSYGASQSSDTSSPVLTLAIQMNGLKSVTLSGVVYASDSSGLTVTFTGAVMATTTTQSDGAFSLTLDADYLGEVHARAVDQNDVASNVASVMVTCDVPVISSFDYTVNNGSFTFRGFVTHPDAVGMPVTIAGQPTSLQTPQTVTVGSDGWF